MQASESLLNQLRLKFDMTKCKIKNCNKKIHALGMCKNHYMFDYYHKDIENSRIKHKKYYQTHKKEMLLTAKKYYIAHRKNVIKKAETYRAKHRKEILLKAKELHQLQRMKVLEHYGGNLPECSCCGETNINF
jgi:hypothetical protein